MYKGYSYKKIRLIDDKDMKGTLSLASLSVPAKGPKGLKGSKAIVDLSVHGLPTTCETQNYNLIPATEQLP